MVPLTLFRSLLASILIFCFLPTIRGDDVACGDGTDGKIRIINARSASGFIYSPGYEKNQNYPLFQTCTYQIQTYQNQHIRIKFIDFDLEATEFCNGDALTIFDFNDQGQGFVSAIFCAKQIPRDFVSSSWAIQLTFKSDGFISNKGFNISYSSSSSSGLCAQGYKTCRNRNCVQSSRVCDGNDDCGDGTDEENCGHPVPTVPCGISEISPLEADVDRIVGGIEVIRGSWPWMADLQYSLVQPNAHMCGGTLINAQWVLSAAHCFEGYREAKDWRVHLGNHNKFDQDPDEQVRYVERLVIFNDIPQDIFARNGKYDIVHDIALLKLNAPVKFTKYVKPACLPNQGWELQAGSQCYATGWGETRGSGSHSVLKQAMHPILTTATCQRVVGGSFQPQSMICAGSLARGNGVCHGDSGGPLVCEIDDLWYIMGVASFISRGNSISGICGLADSPSVFNKVAAKKTYIDRIISRYS